MLIGILYDAGIKRQGKDYPPIVDRTGATVAKIVWFL